MLTLGIDLAAADKGTATALVEWSGGTAAVRALQLGVSDDELVTAIRAVDKAGVDCPLGWPVKFIDFLVAQQGGVLPVPVGDGLAWRRELAYRVTDRFVHTVTGYPPLSVSADRIAHAAFRCAALLSRLASAGEPVDRCGDGVVVEVYPAAALQRWGLTHRGYKTAGRSHGFLVDELTAAAPWLDLGPFAPLCRASHDAFDAVIAALAARASALGHIRMPDAAQRDAARTEGWIALPTCDLINLY